MEAYIIGDNIRKTSIITETKHNWRSNRLGMFTTPEGERVKYISSFEQLRGLWKPKVYRTHISSPKLFKEWHQMLLTRDAQVIDLST